MVEERAQSPMGSHSGSLRASRTRSQGSGPWREASTDVLSRTHSVGHAAVGISQEIFDVVVLGGIPVDEPSPFWLRMKRFVKLLLVIGVILMFALGGKYVQSAIQSLRCVFCEFVHL